MRRRMVILAAVLAMAAGAGFVSIRRAREQVVAIEACDAAARGDSTRTLELTDHDFRADDTARAVAECRCTALLATGRPAECSALLEAALDRSRDDDWAPSAPLSVHLIQTWRDAGREADAAALARRAGRAPPRDPEIFQLELLTRGAVEDEEGVMRELEARIPGAGSAALRMRVTLANRHLLRGDAARALDVLGSAPPARAPGAGRWFDTRGYALAQAGDLAGLRASYADWQRRGGDPNELRVRYAVTLSITGLADPDRTPVEMLREAERIAATLDDPVLHETVLVRLILTLVNDGRVDEAIADYDRGRSQFALSGLSRDELVRASSRRSRNEDAPRAHATIRFEAEGGDVLLLSPDPDAPADSAYTRHALNAAGALDVTIPVGGAPRHWVVRDERGATIASGTASPAAGSRSRVRVRPGSPREAASAHLSRLPADGRRRVLVLLLDCGDWRIVQYLRTRGDLPVLDALISRGYRAVLDSDPPLTAAALDALVHPGGRGPLSFAGLVHQFGVELAGLSSIGENPFAALSWFLPETDDLFGAIGAGDRRAANMLFAHGGIRAGRHSEITGPAGASQRISVANSARDLTSRERRLWPELVDGVPERDAIHVRTIAAELDATEDIVRSHDVDLLALRVEPLDILTHAHFAEASRDGQDDGHGILFSLYRYLDARIGAVHDLLDEDDVLIVMSDHGIETAMEHSRNAFFVVDGAGVPPGRAPGRPSLRGVSLVLANLMGVSTSWPDAGVAPWSSDVRVAATRATPDAPERRTAP